MPRLNSVLYVLSLLTITPALTAREKDPHSFAEPDKVRVEHVDLDLTVDFERHTIRGHVTLSLERSRQDQMQELVLDTRDLRIEKCEASADGKAWQAAKHTLGETHKFMGTPLKVELPAGAKQARVHYSTSPRASGLQWLEREQTAGKRHPFLYTQSQAIHARSWIPLQDSPGVRITYSARIRTPEGLRAVMSASNDPEAKADGDYHFEMKQRIPPYLLALAVGDLDFKAVGPRTGVYAEPALVEKAAREFADMEAMMKATETMYGPYRWDRYDVLVLPPSFPFGGMENPRLTFATPTILAGDRSLVALIAHELAHSWSGNLVSNATWRDFWLNEGFTVYLERRITEKVYGTPRSQMEAVLGRRGLEQEMATLEPRDQILHVDLTGRDPDEGFTGVPYEKGALFLTHVEKTVGRERFDAFLKSYFDHFAFQSITTADFVDYLREHLIKGDSELSAKLAVDEWLYKPGIPGSAPKITADLLTEVEGQANAWLAGKKSTAELRTDKWSTHEWLHFLGLLPVDLSRERMAELDRAFGLTRAGNSEVVFAWLMQAVKSDYEPAYPRLEEFLSSMGRRKFLKPLYEELVKTKAGQERALRIYQKARPLYHPIATNSIDPIVGWK